MTIMAFNMTLYCCFAQKLWICTFTVLSIHTWLSAKNIYSWVCNIAHSAYKRGWYCCPKITSTPINYIQLKQLQCVDNKKEHMLWFGELPSVWQVGGNVWGYQPRFRCWSPNARETSAATQWHLMLWHNVHVHVYICNTIASSVQWKNELWHRWRVDHW